ncbi:nascent polypeptide-associated complex subunit alpha, muscle-specific form-like [Meles meles]|uniref:nascent polypeptide-associated complex subunit alpha, muscle-specific form-like n=1 Tax=Meles meles TaxID=9662 RepID=UPI001E69D75B|nr:nascent polypeptide-associated complex subunit alpha, muscle-specific form-like [Meles meles]
MLYQLGLHNSPLFFSFPFLLYPLFCFSPPAALPVSSALSVTAALRQPESTLPPPCSLAPQQCPLATPNQPSPFLPPSSVVSTPFEAPFPQSSSGTTLPLGVAPSPTDTPVFLPNLIGPPISPAALALASPMITPAVKDAHSSSAPLALVALAPHSVQKSSAYPLNPLNSPPLIAGAESGSVTCLPSPIVSSEPKTSSIQIPMQVGPNLKGTPIPPGIVSAVPSHLGTPLASVQSGAAACPQMPPTTPPAITPPQFKDIPVSSALTSPQNPESLSLKGPLNSTATLPLSTQSISVAPSVTPVFLTSLGSHLAPLHQGSLDSPIQPLGQTGPNVLSNPKVDASSAAHSPIGASYPSQRSVIPPLPSRNEVAPTSGAPASPLVLSIEKDLPAVTAIASFSPSGSSNVATSSPLSPTACLILKGSPNATPRQPLVTQIPPPPGSPSLKEAPVSSVGTIPFVMTNPSTISATPTTLEVATCMSPPVSSGSISSKDSASRTASVMAPGAPRELSTPQVTPLGLPVPPPLSVSENPKGLPTSALVKLPKQGNIQTELPSPLGAPVSPEQAGLPTKKDTTLIPLVLATPKNPPSPQSISSSLEIALSPEASFAKKSLVEPLPVVTSASTAPSPLGVNSPASIIKTDPSSLPLKSSLTTLSTATFPLERVATAEVAPAVTKGTSTPATTASPFLDVSLSHESHPGKKGSSTLTLPVVPPVSESCPMAPAVTLYPQNVSAFPAAIALAPEIPKSEPFPSLHPQGAKKVHGISHTSTLAPVASSPEGHPTKDSGACASVNASSKGAYLADSPSPLGTSVSPQTKRRPAKKGSAPSTTLTLSPLSRSVPAIPDTPVGNHSSPVSPVEASFLPEASLSFQVPKGSLAKKHSPTLSPKETPDTPPPKEAFTPSAMVPSSPKGAPATPFSKGTPTASAVAPSSPKGDPAAPSPEESSIPAVTPSSPKGTPNPQAVAPPSPKESQAIPAPKRAPATPSPKGPPTVPPVALPSPKGGQATPFPKETSTPPAVTPPSPKGSQATPAPKRTPVTPPPKGGTATPSPKEASTPPAMTPSSPQKSPSTQPPRGAPTSQAVPPPSPKEFQATPAPKRAPATPSPKGTPIAPPVAPPTPKGGPATPSPKETSAPPAVTPPSPKESPATQSPKGGPATPSPKETSIPPAVAPSSPKECPATQSPKRAPTTPSPKGAPIAPPVAPPSPKGGPATPSPKETATPPAMAPSSPKGSQATPIECPATQSPKRAPTTPSPKGGPATPSPEENSIPPAVVPSSPKECPATQSPKRAPTTPSPKGAPTALSAAPPSAKGGPATPSPKETSTPPAMAPSSPKGPPTTPSMAPSSPKGGPATPSAKETSIPPAMTPSSPKVFPATQPPRGASTTQVMAPSSSKESQATPSPKGSQATPSPKETSTPPAVAPSSPKESQATPVPKRAPATPPPKGASTPPDVAPPSPKKSQAALAPKRAPATPSPKRGQATPSHKESSTPPTGAPSSPRECPATQPPKGTPTVAPPSHKESQATPAPKRAPATPPPKGPPTAPPMAPPSPKGGPAALSPKETSTPPAVVPSSKKAPGAPSLKGSLTPSAVTPSPKESPETPTPKGAPGTPSPKGQSTPPAVTPSSKESPAAPAPKGTSATPSSKRIPGGTPSPKRAPATPSKGASTPSSESPPSPKEAPTSPVSVTCPLGSIGPLASKGLPVKKGSTALKAGLVAPAPESIPAVTAPSEKGPLAKKSSATSPSVCPDPSAKNGTKGPLPAMAPDPLTVSAQKVSSKAPKTLPVSPLKSKDSSHSPKSPLTLPLESVTSPPLATVSSEKVLPKAGLASIPPAPTPSVSLPLAPSPVPPLLPKQQFLPSSPGLVLESPCKPSAPADEDELPPLIPPEPISGGLPFQSVLVNMPTPKPAGIPAPTPSAKQPVLKNNKGICLGLLCAWCVAHTPPGATHRTNPRMRRFLQCICLCLDIGHRTIILNAKALGI